MSSKTKKAGALTAIAMISLIILAALFSSGILKKSTRADSQPVDDMPDFPADHLFIDASFLLKTGETNESVNISCDLFITNIWEKQSGEIKATAYVSPKNNNLAVFKSTVEFGVIEANSTKELNIPVKFKDNSYKVEILLFESNKLTKKVTLSVTTYQNYYYDLGGKMVINEGRTLDHIQVDGQWSIENTAAQVTSVH